MRARLRPVAGSLGISVAAVFVPVMVGVLVLLLASVATWFVFKKGSGVFIRRKTARGLPLH